MNRQSLFLFGMLTLFSNIAFNVNAELITNGSFEDPDIPTGTVENNIASIPGWTVGTVDLLGFLGYSGEQSLDLVGSPSPGFIEQSVSTLPGQELVLSFYLRSAPSVGGLLEDAVRVMWDGAEVAVFDANEVYAQQTLLLNAAGTSGVLRFEGLNSGTNASGPIIDDVSLVDVPEPTSLLLAAAGGLIWCSRRRR